MFVVLFFSLDLVELSQGLRDIHRGPWREISYGKQIRGWWTLPNFFSSCIETVIFPFSDMIPSETKVYARIDMLPLDSLRLMDSIWNCYIPEDIQMFRVAAVKYLCCSASSLFSV